MAIDGENEKAIWAGIRRGSLLLLNFAAFSLALYPNTHFPLLCTTMNLRHYRRCPLCIKYFTMARLPFCSLLTLHLGPFYASQHD